MISSKDEKNIMYLRYLKMDLPIKQSAFLWGARKTGKSTYLRLKYPYSKRFDLLDSMLEQKFLKSPWEFREEVLKLTEDEFKHPIIVDEVQKVPSIMDEIHWLIENSGAYFILCGSSARKMRRSGVNLLGGRAYGYKFFPLVYPEFKEDFDLLKIFNNGLIPSHYSLSSPKKILQAYIRDYLSLEVKAESLVRNLVGFNRFLDAVAFCHGEMINYSNIAREVGIDATTVKEYFQILEDTLIGYFVYPYRKVANRRIISFVPKFYFFDVGIANRLASNSFDIIKGIEAGKSLEHYIFLELYSYVNLNDLDYKISYWRTHTGIEVDFVAHLKKGLPIPIEVKISETIHKTEFKNMKIFMKEYGVKTGYIICMCDRARRHVFEEGEIIIYPVREFLEDLWAGKIFK